MSKGHAVVDGSNIATEGRSTPSLKQLREAVEEFQAENHFKRVTVIVDASFEHRVSSREKKAARAAIDAGELITPPAGVIGRGDTFILEVADRADAVVLSNDSFQEFHGTYKWLFDEGRLIGGKPVPGVGWVYVPRAPVRGPVSRRATTAAKKKAKDAPAGKPGDDKLKPAPGEPTPAIGASKKASTRSRREETPETSSDRDGANADGVWKEFRHDYPVGSTVAVEVERFSSHGAYGTVGDAVVYLPNRLLADPPPTRARDVLAVGETRDFLVHTFDEDRRGIDLGLVSLPGASPPAPAPARSAAKRSATRKPTAKKASPKKTAAKKKTTAKSTTRKKTTAKKTKKTADARAAAKKSTAKKASPKKTAAQKTTAKKTTRKPTTRKRATTARKAAKKA